MFPSDVYCMLRAARTNLRFSPFPGYSQEKLFFSLALKQFMLARSSYPNE